MSKPNILEFKRDSDDTVFQKSRDLLRKREKLRARLSKKEKELRERGYTSVFRH